MDQLLTAQETAARLRVSINTLRAMVQAGRVPVVRIGARGYRFDWESVLQALKSQDQGSDGEE
jgi:excisionase family DNA binding protein